MLLKLSIGGKTLTNESFFSSLVPSYGGGGLRIADGVKN